MVKQERVFFYQRNSLAKGPVIYWMSREQRMNENWGLLYACQVAKELKTSMAVVFCLTTGYPGANMRHFDFLLRGLKQVEHGLRLRNIPFFLLKGDPVKSLPLFLQEYKADFVVTDFDPLRIKMNWRSELSRLQGITLAEVDSHNIVPCRKLSHKLEFAAYTIRPKIKKQLPSFLDSFPEVPRLKKGGPFDQVQINWDEELKSLETDHSVKPIEWIEPGEEAARKMLYDFLDTRIDHFHEKRNDPNENALSNLSPYFHFGQLSPQFAAIEALRLPREGGVEAFLEEMIVRRELSDNFCFYNKDYDNFNGFPDWAKKSLNEHRNDEREFIYSKQEFEEAKTHDTLWNAAQNEMILKGKMHGYMRMYWAKKILEWTRTPEEALQISLYLNDKYELDGRDPNGFTGCAWSIGGIHDRAWSERPVFGKIRFMNYNGCKRKFDVDRYINNNTLA